MEILTVVSAAQPFLLLQACLLLALHHHFCFFTSSSKSTFASSFLSGLDFVVSLEGRKICRSRFVTMKILVESEHEMPSLFTFYCLTWQRERFL